MEWAAAILVVALAMLAGSPLLLPHRTDRRPKRPFIKMPRIRLRTR
jgi:hypothetical protein